MILRRGGLSGAAVYGQFTLPAPLNTKFCGWYGCGTGGFAPPPQQYNAALTEAQSKGWSVPYGSDYAGVLYVNPDGTMGRITDFADYPPSKFYTGQQWWFDQASATWRLFQPDTPAAGGSGTWSQPYTSTQWQARPIDPAFVLSPIDEWGAKVAATGVATMAQIEASYQAQAAAAAAAASQTATPGASPTSTPPASTPPAGGGSGGGSAMTPPPPKSPGTGTPAACSGVQLGFWCASPLVLVAVAAGAFFVMRGRL